MTKPPGARAAPRAGSMAGERVPQGTLIASIRAGGYGLGGTLTATGVRTAVEDGAQD